MTKLQQEKLKRTLKQEKLLKRIIPLLLTVPYFLGIIWTLLHPILSVVTGELKCRGKYIDENGLDVHRHRVESYPLQRGVLQQSSNNNNRLDMYVNQFRNGALLRAFQVATSNNADACFLSGERNFLGYANFGEDINWGTDDFQVEVANQGQHDISVDLAQVEMEWILAQ